jgi:hypothetical protein
MRSWHPPPLRLPPTDPMPLQHPRRRRRVAGRVQQWPLAATRRLLSLGPLHHAAGRAGSGCDGSRGSGRHRRGPAVRAEGAQRSALGLVPQDQAANLLVAAICVPAGRRGRRPAARVPGGMPRWRRQHQRRRRHSGPCRAAARRAAAVAAPLGGAGPRRTAAHACVQGDGRPADRAASGMAGYVAGPHRSGAERPVHGGVCGWRAGEGTRHDRDEREGLARRRGLSAV